MPDLKKWPFYSLWEQHIKLARRGRRMTYSLITDFVILQKLLYRTMNSCKTEKEEHTCVLVFEIRPTVTTVHSCKPCTNVQRERSKGSHQINMLCSSSPFNSKLLFICFNKHYHNSRCWCLASQSMLCSAESQVAQKF